MFKAAIIYFSGTGNTWWAADKIKKQLDSRNINADIVSIDTLDAKKANWWIKTADLVIFGWPVYGSDLPEPMKKFIDGLMPVTKGKHVHTFCTQMKFSGDGAWLYHKNFEKKGLIIDSAAHFIMPSNVSVYRHVINPPKSKEKIDSIIEKCGQQIEKYVEELLTGKSKIQGKNSYLLGILQRGPYRLFYKQFQDLLGIDETRCNKCGICAQLCPSDNIKMKDFPEFAGKCALCLRCYTFCPKSAITYKNKSRNLEKCGKPYRIADKRFKPNLLK